MRFLALVAIFHVICNNDDRRQRRTEGEVVGAAASRTRVHLHEANAGSRNPGSIKKSPFCPWASGERATLQETSHSRHLGTGKWAAACVLDTAPSPPLRAADYTIP